jgi:hypothetical protein
VGAAQQNQQYAMAPCIPKPRDFCSARAGLWFMAFKLLRVHFPAAILSRRAVGNSHATKTSANNVLYRSAFIAKLVLSPITLMSGKGTPPSRKKGGPREKEGYFLAIAFLLK